MGWREKKQARNKTKNRERARVLKRPPWPLLAGETEAPVAGETEAPVLRQRDIAKPVKSWGLASLLPFHIVVSILSWLPIKSLLRFRCVCKEWRSLTCNLNFIKEQHACARALGRLALISIRYWSPRIFLYDFGDNGEVRNREFDMRSGDQNAYAISNPANGLICGEYGNPDRDDEGNHYLMNPATGELAKLPTGGNSPHGKISTLGLGFDSSTGGYKLVKLFEIEGCWDHCGCKVLELGTQEWQEVGVAPCMLPWTAPVLLNGALHWISTRRPTWDIDYEELTIMAFNLKEEKFRSTTVPRECGSQICKVNLVEWEGLLCLVKVPTWLGGQSRGRRRGLVRIWRMEDYATCIWREAHCSELPNPTYIGGQTLTVVGIRGHEMLLELFQGGLFGSFWCYDLRTRSLRVMSNEYLNGLQFLTESMVSPRYLAGNLTLD